MPDNGGCYLVPAFAGLYAPHWEDRAQGLLVGLTSFVDRGHLARAVLEATAWQTADVVEAMTKDAGVPMTSLAVDGGMTGNNLLMQTVADCLGVPRHPPDDGGDRRAGRRLRGRARRWATGPTVPSSGRTGTGPPSGRRRSSRSSEQPSSPGGGTR